MLGNGRSGYSTETIGFMFLAVSGDFPKSDYESAALTAELRARDDVCQSPSQVFYRSSSVPSVFSETSLTDRLLHDPQEIPAHHLVHVRFAVTSFAQGSRQRRHL